MPLVIHPKTGTATNDAAVAGQIGELISSTVLTGSSVALTTATAKTITSISLTAGDWDVWFECMFNGGAATVLSLIEASISTTTDTMVVTPGSYAGQGFAIQGSTTIFNAGINQISCIAGPLRVSLAATTTYYGVAKAGFATSTCGGFGILRARRMR